MDNLN